MCKQHFSKTSFLIWLLYHILISFLPGSGPGVLVDSYLRYRTQLPAAMWICKLTTVQHLVVLDVVHWISWRFTVASQHLEAGQPVGVSVTVFGLIFTIPEHHFFSWCFHAFSFQLLRGPALHWINMQLFLKDLRNVGTTSFRVSSIQHIPNLVKSNLNPPK